MGLLELFVTASMPMLKVLVIIAVGSLLATPRVAILGEDTMKHLNNVVFYIYNPALVATNLSKTVTLDSIILLWFMPFNLILNNLVGSALGWVIIQITKAPAKLRGVILASCSAGNVGNLLLILVPAMCEEKGSPFGAPDICNTYGLAYASLSMAIGTILQWLYVFNIVRICSSSSYDKGKDQIQTMISAAENIETTLTTSDIQDCAAETEVPASSNIRCLKLSELIDTKKIFAPSTIGAIVGFTIGAIPQFKKAMIGQTAPLRVFQDSAALLGSGAIPSLILLMGGNLSKGLHGHGIKFSIILGVMVVRYIALPVLGITIVKGAINLGMVHSDPLYQFILLIQHAVPPAINIASMIQILGDGEGELSVLFLWAYSIASVALTLWSTLILWIVS